MDNDVVVIGSINVDLITSVERRPFGGETVLASDLVRRPGGKGANQAAAAARAGANTAFIGMVGDDPDGVAQLAELERLGIDISHAQVVANTVTGMAFITVTHDGENSIVVARGANAALTPELVLSTLGTSSEIAVVALQTEIAAEVVDAAAQWCHETGTRLVLNNGPSIELKQLTLATADPLVVNEHEARDIIGETDAGEDLAVSVRTQTGAVSVVVTLGARGTLVADEQGSRHVLPIQPEKLVDTTGAGDAFVGALAAHLSHGEDLGAAVVAGSRAGSDAVSWVGARPPEPAFGA